MGNLFSPVYEHHVYEPVSYLSDVWEFIKTRHYIVEKEYLDDIKKGIVKDNELLQDDTKKGDKELIERIRYRLEASIDQLFVMKGRYHISTSSRGIKEYKDCYRQLSMLGYVVYVAGMKNDFDFIVQFCKRYSTEEKLNDDLLNPLGIIILGDDQNEWEVQKFSDTVRITSPLCMLIKFMETNEDKYKTMFDDIIQRASIDEKTVLKIKI